jgi:hypothetical protein
MYILQDINKTLFKEYCNIRGAESTRVRKRAFGEMFRIWGKILEQLLDKTVLFGSASRKNFRKVFPVRANFLTSPVFLAFLII